MLSKDEIVFVMKQTRMFDLRVLGCPENVFIELVEDRAKKISGKLAEFRSRQTAAPVPTTDLDVQVQSSKLF